jgi:import inner membrane translocase subunit TIM9
MNFPLDAVSGMPDEAKNALMAALEHMQIRDSLQTYNNLVEKCFMGCVEEFKGKTLLAKEEQCVIKCTEKYINSTGRVAARFQDFFTQMEAEAAKAMLEK